MKPVITIPVLLCAAMVVLLSWGQNSLPKVETQSPADPCLKANFPKTEVRNCYAKEQQRITEEADSVVHKVILILRDDAKSPKLRGHISGDLRTSASALERSQTQWKEYREHYCHAVQYSYTANTPEREWGYERCLLQDARLRLRQLRSDFAGVGSIEPDNDSAPTAK